jgi:hypothetical protein
MTRFDIDALRELAGDKVFARGQAYHQAGQVTILAIEKSRVVARVSGSEDYRTALTGFGKTIGGDCSCPAFADFGFCKHLVATALTANDSDEVDDGTLGRIRRHLLSLGTEALAAMVLDLAERDESLFRRLEMEATAASDDDDTLFARYGKAIKDATRTGSFVPYREAAGWASEVEAVLERVAALVPQGRGALALRLVDIALSRLEEAINEIDDSDGWCGGLLDRAQEIHLAACCAVRPDPVDLARDLFSREVEGDWDSFHGAAAEYADVLGDAGLAEFRRLAAEAWAKIPPLPAGRRARDDFSSQRHRLAVIMDFFAEREDDIDARIALRTHDLTSPRQYLNLAQFCLSHGREADALRHAEDGLWLFEDDPPDERLVGFAVDLHLKAGRTSEAEALLWRAFGKRASLDLYRKLRDMGGVAARDRALAALRARLGKAPQSRWDFPADLLIRVLMVEALFDEAWATVHNHGASGSLQETLARASEATHPKEALAVYAARIDQLVLAGGNPNYEEAYALLARMAPLRVAADQAAHVLALKTRFKAKRNFMKLLGK